MKNVSKRLKRVVMYATALSVLALGTSACNEFNTNGRKGKKGESEGKSFKIGGKYVRHFLDLLISPSYAGGYDASTCKIATVSSKDKVGEAATAMINSYGYNSPVGDAIAKGDEAAYQKTLTDVFGKDAKFAADYTASFCAASASPDPANCAFATVSSPGKVQDAAMTTIYTYKHDVVADTIKKVDAKGYAVEIANAFKADPKFAADYGASYCVAGASAPDPAACLMSNVRSSDAVMNDAMKLSSGSGYPNIADTIKMNDSAKYGVLITAVFAKDAAFASTYAAKYCIPKVLPVAYCEMPVSPSSVMSAAIVTNKYGYDSLMTFVYKLDKSGYETAYKTLVRKDAKFEADFKSSCEPVKVSEVSPNAQTVAACIANASTGICAALKADNKLVSVVPVNADKSYSFDFGSQDPSELYAGQILSVAIFDKSIVVTPGSAVYGQSDYNPVREAVIGKAKSDFIPNSGVTVVPIDSQTTAVASIVAASYSQPSAMKSAVNNIGASDLVAMLQQISGVNLNFDTLEAANVDVVDPKAILQWMLDNNTSYVSAMDTIKSKSASSDFVSFIASFDTLRASQGDTTSVFGATTTAQTNMAADLLANVKNASSIADMINAFWAIDSLYGSAKGDFATSLEISADDAQVVIMDRLNKVVAGGNPDEITAAFTAIDNYYNNGPWMMPNLAPFDDIWTVANDAYNSF